MKRTACQLALLLPLLIPDAFAQGDLDPPAGPHPSMKTLQQIEPRVDVFNAPDTRVDATDPQWAYVIKTPGSYYLSKNMTVGIASTEPLPEARPNGIRIDASDVTLDLRGHTISSGPSVGDSSIAIGISADRHRATIHDGTIRGSTTVTASKEGDLWSWSIAAGGFTHGVRAMGIADEDNQGCRFSNITVSGCRQIAIDLGSAGIVESCITTSNGSTGINAASSAIDRCLATYNGDGGILAENGSVTNCVTKWNQGYGIESAGGVVGNSTGSENGGSGIKVTAGSVSRCVARGNNIMGFETLGGTSLMNCTAASNYTTGIVADHGSVTNCVAMSNRFHGIQANDGAVTGCAASNNNLSGGAFPDIELGGGTGTGNFPVP